MSKKFIFIAILIAIAGLAASFFLMPRSQEIALMQMKDKNFEDARIAYEAQLASGNLSIEVVTRLSELYLQTGEVNKAIEVMEKFIAANPASLEARRQLGTYYQYAQRQDDYLRNLEEINKL
jgi:tetratricopeptide (TPR) repeat protein